MHADSLHSFLLRWSTVGLLAIWGLSACGSKDGPGVASQVAAKVGSEEISIHQINQALAKTSTANASPEEITAMSRVVLEKLIDQQLALGQAVEGKLNHTPEVVTQLEAARRDVLAGAYIKQLVSGVPRPTAEEGRKYFAQHPQLFAQRRIFNVQEIVVAPDSGATAQLHSFASSGKSMEEIAAWLKAKDIPFTGGGATRAAEQIPLEELPLVHALQDGQTTVLDTPAAVTVLHLVSSQSAPVTDAVALPRIAQFLMNQRINTAVASNLQQLRASTKITYMGEFASAGALANKPTSPAAVPVVANGDASRTALDKGVAGLK